MRKPWGATPALARKMLVAGSLRTLIAGWPGEGGAGNDDRGKTPTYIEGNSNAPGRPEDCMKVSPRSPAALMSIDG
jgi:hypothetical protein